MGASWHCLRSLTQEIPMNLIPSVLIGVPSRGARGQACGVWGGDKPEKASASLGTQSGLSSALSAESLQCKMTLRRA